MLIVTVDQRGNYSSDSGLRLDSKAISFFTFKNIKGQSNQKQYKVRNDHSIATAGLAIRN